MCRLNLVLGLLFGIAGFSWNVGIVRAAQEGSPNILVLLADDAGWRDFGFAGNEAIRTPNLDRLAAGGMLCSNAFLTTSSCSPTRISVLTGKYPHATGAEDLHSPLPADQVMVPTYLKKKGYFTGHMRKTHYGPNGVKQFDWYSHELEDFPKFLDACGHHPFFMWVGFTDPHRPYKKGAVDPPHDPAKVKVRPYLVDTPETRADLALYYDEISRMDGNVGEFVVELKRRELMDNTLIVFFSDNGEPFPRAKGTVYDAGIRTPIIFHWPAVIKPGTVYEGLSSVIDLAPTWLEMAGIPKPADMQGDSVLATIKDPTRPGRKYVFAERNWHNCDEHIRCVRTERYKLIRNAYLDLPFGKLSDAYSCPSWHSLVRYKDEGKLTPGQLSVFQAPRPRIEFYDVQKDPWELTNLADWPDCAETVKELEAILDRWCAQTGDFPPTRRRRADNVDRITGVKTSKAVPPLKE